MSAHEFTLYDMLSRNAVMYGDRPAVIHVQGSMTFRDFLARVEIIISTFVVFSDSWSLKAAVHNFHRNCSIRRKMTLSRPIQKRLQS